MIELEHVSVRCGRHRILDDLNLEIDAGESVLVTGPSGCGKTTLTRCLNGLIPHAIPADLEGRVLVGGTPTTARTVADLSTTVGLVFQNPATQLFNLTVEEEVAFGPRNLGLDEEDVGERAGWALDLTATAGLRTRPVHALSGGEQQRVAIAAVLAMRPSVLILDEPTSSLDARARGDLMATLRSLRETWGVTVVVVEHRLGEVARLASRTLVMQEGRILVDGPTEAIFADRDLLRGLGVRRPGETTLDDWGALLVPRAPAGGTPIVTFEGVDAGYRGRRVLRGLDLVLHEGEFAALVGENGAGKSTVARLLAGLMKPERGTVRWQRQRLVPGRDVGLLFQNPLHQLFCVRVDEEVGFGPENFKMTDGAAKDAAMSATDLSALRHRAVHTLSSGQQQRTALAAVLATRPRLIILDEPTLGQDWGHLSRFMEYLVELNRAGCAILLISHDYKLVHRYAQRVMVLQEGRVVVDGAPAGPFRPSSQEDAHAVSHP